MPTLIRLMLLLALVAIAVGVAIGFLQYPYVCLLIVGAAGWRQANAWRGSLTSHGSARLANQLDLAGMVGREDGLILGRATLAGPPTRWIAFRCLISPKIPSTLACRLAFAAFFKRPNRGLIRVHDYTHVLTIAPSGAGKSVAAIIPNLLSHLGSTVVVDPKGELFKATAEFRRKRLGHKIIRLDPFGIAGPAETSDRLNPLDFIDENDPEFADEVKALADTLVIRKGTETDPHWNEMAVLILAAFSSFVAGCEPDDAKRTFAVVRSILSSRSRYTEAMAAMQTIDAYNGVISRFGELLTWLVDREQGSVMTSVHRHTSWMDSPPVAACMSKSSFNPRWLRTGRVTIYLILPAHKLSTLAPLMRCWLGTIMRVATKQGASEENPVLFVIDEAAQLGDMKILRDGLALMRGYGIRIWLLFQSLEQLKTCYGEHAADMLDNLKTQQYFGINSFDTSDHLSKRLGDCTILVESLNVGRTVSRPNRAGTAEGAGSVSTTETHNVGPQGRRLIRPEEWLMLPDSVGIVFHSNRRPIATELVRYFDAREFARGRRGQDRRLGVSALAASVIVLAACLGFAAFTLSITSSGMLSKVDFAKPFGFEWRPAPPPEPYFRFNFDHLRPAR